MTSERRALWTAVLALTTLTGWQARAQRVPSDRPPMIDKAGWTQLWNGKNLDGWKHVGPGRFVIEDGMLKSEGGMGLLWYTRRKFGNCVIRVVYKTTKKTDNSGVFIRIPEPATEPWMPVNKGYEVQIDDSDDDYHVTGVLYSLTKAAARPGKTGEWNTMDIAIEGPRTIVLLNGVEVTDYTEGQPVPPKKKSYEPDRGPRPNAGFIGLQNHSDKDTVYFGEVAERGLGQ
ncbi:MAG TPA: DUF1080 domain-containing protein [Candidatus Acidoferrum sp.]|nr:DUF1080 domain-containing protein [Candidatus Acidoferrum sp.]